MQDECERHQERRHESEREPRGQLGCRGRVEDLRWPGVSHDAEPNGYHQVCQTEEIEDDREPSTAGTVQSISYAEGGQADDYIADAGWERPKRRHLSSEHRRPQAATR